MEKTYAKNAEQLYIAVRSDGLVMSTATYQLPPATVRKVVTNAVVFNMYGHGDLEVVVVVRCKSCDCTI